MSAADFSQLNRFESGILVKGMMPSISHKSVVLKAREQVRTSFHSRGEESPFDEGLSILRSVFDDVDLQAPTFPQVQLTSLNPPGQNHGSTDVPEGLADCDPCTRIFRTDSLPPLMVAWIFAGIAGSMMSALFGEDPAGCTLSP